MNEPGTRVQVRTVEGSTTKVAIHRLAAVAWFGWGAVSGNVVHHENGVPWDNRESNLTPMTLSEHSKLHADPEEARKTMVEHEVWKHRSNVEVSPDE